MGAATRSTRIAAPASRVWEILARRVELRSPMGVRWANHLVAAWEPGSTVAWKATDSNFPLLASAEQTVRLSASGDATEVDNTVAYELAYGPLLGRVVDALMFARGVSGAADGFVASLRRRAESR